jgi:hypothetical protein
MLTILGWVGAGLSNSPNRVNGAEAGEGHKWHNSVVTKLRITPARGCLQGLFGRPICGNGARGAPGTMMTMKKIASILLSLSILTGIVGQANAADVSGSKEYEQPRREIR